MKYIVISCILALFACNSNSETSYVKEKINTDSIGAPSSKSSGKTAIAEAGPDCTHRKIQTIVRKGSFPGSTFELQPDNGAGVETINFENGDKLFIRNWGCDYAALTFRFETSRFQGEPTNMGFWYKRAVTLLNEVNAKLDAPVDVVKGTDRLVTQIEKELPTGYENLKLNEELDFGDEATRNFVSVDKIEKLDDKKMAVEITFAKGPLK